ncbi:alpha/beta hydrolase [Spirochaetia bacterium]|nr:alpha/beta hydrolase [Spirochaetia bacterium]
MIIPVWIPRIAGVLALLYLVGVLAAGIFAYGFMVKCRSESSRLILKRGIERREVPPEVLALPWESEKVLSPRRNSLLALWALPGAIPGGGTIILLHGILSDHYEEIKYAAGFIEQGWNVVMVDLAGYGDSPEGTIPNPSFGYYEKYDLDAVVDWTHSRFPRSGPLIVAGESMGAATALQYLSLGSQKIDGVIADCSYTSAADETLNLYKLSHIPAFIAYPALNIGNVVIKLVRGYSLFKASPLAGSLSGPTPVLFIHGGDDHFVPTRMSVRMAEARRQAGLTATVLAIFDGAGHTESIRVDRERWFREAFSFIDTYCK